jgi:hypothetical protein
LFLKKLFNAVLRRQYFPTALKHDRVVSILMIGKNSALRSSYTSISIIDIIGKLFENILLSRVLKELN